MATVLKCKMCGGDIEVSQDMTVDSFMIGNVYILGCALEPSEFDLWWLIGKKKLLNVPHGRIYYFAPKWERDERNIEKYELMKCFGIEVKDDFSCNEDDRKYEKYYDYAIEEIIKMK